MRVPLVLALAVTAAAANGQAPEPPAPVLRNDGNPVRVAFACAADDIRLHGLTCPAGEPCPVYLELAGFEPVGGRLFLAGNLHTETTTLASVLLASDDGGKTWREPFGRIRSAALDRIQFYDLESGWISGQHLAAGLPRDPFFLLTTDGGKTWRDRPVYAESGKIGAIDRFRFESKVRGTVWIDASEAGEPARRSEIYDSMTGGESWTVREISDKKPAGEKAPFPESWRLRADAASKSYRLEKQSDGQWQPVAAFLVSAGECKEPEVVFAEPPPPEAPKPAEAPKPQQ